MVVSSPESAIRVLVVSETAQFEGFIACLGSADAGDFETEHLRDRARLASSVHSFNPSVVLFLLDGGSDAQLTAGMVETLGVIPFLVGGVPADPLLLSLIHI